METRYSQLAGGLALSPEGENLRVRSIGFRVQGSGSRVQGSGFRGSGLRGLRFRV